MRINTESQGDQGLITTLAGSVPDQAALSGVLETLYDSHFKLLSVEILKGENKYQRIKGRNLIFGVTMD